MFDNLTEKFERAFKVLKGQGQITEINVAETLKEVRRALLDADVNFKTAKEFANHIKEKALGQGVLTAVSPSQLMTKICHEELVELIEEKRETGIFLTIELIKDSSANNTRVESNSAGLNLESSVAATFTCPVCCAHSTTFRTRFLSLKWSPIISGFPISKKSKFFLIKAPASWILFS